MISTLQQDNRHSMSSVFGYYIYLSWCVTDDELVVNVLGFGGQFRWFRRPVVLASQVEGDVFLTELWDQERSKQAQSIWKQKRKAG